MHRIAAIVETWRNQRRDRAVARVVGTEGLGPQQRDELLVLDAEGRTGGSLLGGAVPPELTVAARDLLRSTGTHVLLSLDIDASDATAAGLTCGGTVQVLLQRLDAIPEPLWESFADGRPVALVTPLDGELRPVVVLADSVLSGSLGGSGIDTLVQAEAEALLGWVATTVIHVDAATAAIAHLGHGDAVVVIDHDPFVATPALAAALQGGVGYVGALGSRRTQAHRREHLTDIGVPARAIERLHGPTGLDLGARNTAESAVSIVAEIIATRGGRTGSSLTTVTGRING